MNLRGVILPGIRQRALVAAVGVSLLIVPKIFAQTTVPAIASPPPGQATTGATAEVERVIVTGSNIPTAEETGPNPVDTYRPADIEKLGIRNSTDLLTSLPQEMGATINQNVSQGSDGSVIPNLRGLLPKETLVLIDGKRVAINGFGGTFIGNSQGCWRGYQPHSFSDDRSYRHPERRRVRCVWLRRGGRCDQLFFDTQVSWP